MQRFSSQEETDKVLTDYAKIVEGETGIKLFQNI